MRPAVRTGAILALALLGVMPRWVHAQGTPASAPRPGWLPRTVRFQGLTAAQRAEAAERLDAIVAILQQVPALANPQGFELQPHYYGGGRRLGPGETERADYVVEYMVRLGFYVPTKQVAGQGCTCIEITVNSNTNFGGQTIRDAAGREIYVEVGRGERVPSATQAWGRLSPSERSIVDVLLTPGSVEPWKPVTREEFYEAAILDYEGKDGAHLAEIRAASGKTPYQEWMEGAEERRKSREEALRMAATVQSPAEVAAMRKMMEGTEREVTENLRASEADDRDRNAAAAAAHGGQAAKMRAELAEMSPELRRMPALVDNAAPAGPDATGWRLVEQDSPTAWRVLTPDYDYWRARRSVVESRSIVVHIGASGTGLQPPVHRALWAVYNTLDWAALKRIADTSD